MGALATRPRHPRLPLGLGLDVGSSSVRALAFDAAGRALSVGQVPTPTVRERSGWAEFPADALWQAVLSALGAALRDLPERAAITGIAVASVGESGFLLDGAGQELGPSIAWYDERTAEQLKQLRDRPGFRQLTDITGLAPDLGFSLCKLAWVRQHQPELFARARRWLNIADWVAFRLSGVGRTDPSLAARTLLFDLRRRSWSMALMEEVGLSPELFAPLAANGTALGPVRAEIAASLGLPAGVTVGVGGHDHVLGALAAGASEPGRVIDSMGTAEALFRTAPEPIFAPEIFARGYPQGAVDAGQPLTYILGGLYTSGGAVEWARLTLMSGVENAQMIRAAEAAPVGAGGLLFVPHLRHSAMPNPDTLARGALVGLNADTGPGELARAVYEGVAMELRLVLDGLADIDGVPPPRQIRAIGGGVRNRLLLKIKASVYNRPIEVAEMAEATALGAALMGALAADTFPDLPAALAALDVTWRTVEPVAEWTDAYEQLHHNAYERSFAALRPLHHALAGL